MKRKIEQRLLDWKEKEARQSAVLLEGARRVGKSYIVEKFARENYKSYILIDFNEVSEEVKDIFNYNLQDLDTFFLYLSNFYQTKLYERESLIIFDEVQLFPRARSAIKYLIEDGRYDYIETGSLVSIKSNTEGILIPSEEKHLALFPMDFEEFLWAMGEEQLCEYIRERFEEKKEMGGLLHRKAMEAMRLYEIIGGMPQAIEVFLETKDFERVDAVKRNILDLYRDDIRKHAGIYAERVEQIYDDIPAQLQRHDKKFRLASLDKNARMRNRAEAFMWLIDAKIVNPCYNTTAPSVGLTMNQERTTMKLYMADTGLLIARAFGNKEIVSEKIYQKILTDKLSFNQGMVIENLVAQTLRTNGHKLYFYAEAGREKNKDDRMEIDFLIQKSTITSRHNISPIEVKSGKNYTLNSLMKFRKKFKEELDKSYIVHTGDLRVDKEVTYLPLYMVHLL